MKLECHPDKNIILIPFPLFTKKSLYWVGIPHKKDTYKRATPTSTLYYCFQGFGILPEAFV